MAFFTNLMAMWRKPLYVQAGIFAPGTDLSWIPDVNSNLVVQAPTETPDGVNATFTFNIAPKFILWNGLAQFPGVGYTANSNLATFPVPPGVGDNIMGVM